MKALIAVVLSLLSVVAATSVADERRVEWAGSGRFRLLVEVAPLDLGGREKDELPAELVVDWPKALRESATADKADMASVQVMRYDPATGKPLRSASYAYPRSPYDAPFRWYDAAIPYEFPEFPRDITSTQGKIQRVRSVRAGYFYAAMGNWERGHLAWLHTQQGKQPSCYAIYFDVIPLSREPDQAPPAGWLGDGLGRFDKTPGSSTGTDHTRVAVDDWDDDDQLDIVFGESAGCVFWFPNRGTARQPDYRYYRMVLDADGLPLDVGMSAAPLVVDWNGDGRKDLLVGTHWNRIVFFENQGDNRHRNLALRGFVHTDGAPVELPVESVAGRPEDVFKQDYYPTLEVADWNGDGTPDLLVGGYLTGRIYLYENTGRDAQGVPKLTPRGPLQADGQPLNVGDWCASPTVADFDGDGDLDLISGRTAMTPASGADTAAMRYYENVGTAKQPDLRARPFPGKGKSLIRSMASPRAADWNGDGLVDLVVSARYEIFLYENVRTKTQPLFDLDAKPLRPAWGAGDLSVDQFLDWDGDGRVDIHNNYTVLLNDGVGNPYRFGSRQVQVLPAGQRIAHPSHIGDDWFWPFLYDFDRDGRHDVLFGDWWGRVWFHRNRSQGDEKAFDLTGHPLKLASGQEIMVGPEDKDPSRNFTALQGARTVFAAADFDRDGLNDLVVGDTFGLIRYYRNAGTAALPPFAPPIVIGNQRIRLLVEATDWNRDGWPDIIAGAANGIVRLYLNTAGKKPTPFEEGKDLSLPPVKQPRVMMADLNGDGDDDLFLPSVQGSVFLERSFLQHGYAPGRLLRLEKRPNR